MDARIKSGHDECDCVRTNVDFKQRHTLHPQLRDLAA